jgi:GTPase SAR1 family protein
MGFIFSKLFTFIFGDKRLKLLILGLDNAGKTTLLYLLKLGKVVKTTPSMI